MSNANVIGWCHWVVVRADRTRAHCICMLEWQFPNKPARIEQELKV
jgi:hypothetical protein